MRTLLEWLKTYLQTGRHGCVDCRTTLSKIKKLNKKKNGKMTVLLHLTKTNGVVEVHIGEQKHD